MLPTALLIACTVLLVIVLVCVITNRRRIDQLSYVLNKFADTHENMQKDYNWLTEVLKQQNQLLERGTTMDLAALLVFIANNDEDRAMAVLKDKHFLEVYRTAGMEYKTYQQFEAMMRCQEFVDAMVKNGCKDQLDMLKDFYNSLEAKTEFGMWLKLSMTTSDLPKEEEKG